MTAPGYGTFQFSNNVYPIPSSTANSALQDADSTMFWLLDFNAWVLQNYAGARWTAECNRIGRSDVANIVAMKVPYNPGPYLTTATFTFPLFALYRAGRGRITDKTMGRHEVITRVEAVWIMPPVTPSELEALNPFLSAVVNILADRNEQGFDPGYNDGYSVGEAAGYDSFWPMDVEYALLPGTETNLVFPTVIVGFELMERRERVPGQYQDFDGVDYVLNNTTPNA